MILASQAMFLVSDSTRDFKLSSDSEMLDKSLVSASNFNKTSRFLSILRDSEIVNIVNSTVSYINISTCTALVHTSIIQL